MSPLSLTPLLGSIVATVTIPASKSYTNRALYLAALVGGGVEIKNPLISDDTEAMCQCLRTLGYEIERQEGSFFVRELKKHIDVSVYELDANLSGTTIRFILAFACVTPGVKTVCGKDGLNKRPIGDLVEALRQLGADIQYLECDGFPPIRIASSKLTGGTVHVNGETSSQFLSALLMIAPLVGNVVIEVKGEQISKPYVDMTLDTMAHFGVAVVNEHYKRYRVGRGSYVAEEYTVEGDISSASYFAAIAALTKSTITLAQVNPHSKQADMGFLKILERMGNTITYGANEITIDGAGVKPLNVSMESCPDQAQTLAVLAAFAEGTTTITGVRSLRVKETERVRALEAELEKMGIKTESTHDTLVIHGGAPKAAAINTYGDHRMAMSFAVAGTKLGGMTINDPGVVAKTFPDFWEKLESIGVGIKQI